MHNITEKPQKSLAIKLNPKNPLPSQQIVDPKTELYGQTEIQAKNPTTRRIVTKIVLQILEIKTIEQKTKKKIKNPRSFRRSKKKKKAENSGGNRTLISTRQRLGNFAERANDFGVFDFQVRFVYFCFVVEEQRAAGVTCCYGNFVTDRHVECNKWTAATTALIWHGYVSNVNAWEIFTYLP